MRRAEALQHYTFKLFDNIRMLLRNVMKFTGIGFEVEENFVSPGRGIDNHIPISSRPSAGAVNEFPALRSDVGLFVFKIFTEDLLAWLDPAAFEIGPQTAPVLYGKRIEFHHVANRRAQVDVLCHGLDDARLYAARIPYDQRHAKRGVVAAVLFETAMLAQVIPVVGRVHDERIVLEVQFAQFSKHQPYIAIEKLNRGVIGRNDASLISCGEIPEDQRDLPVVFRANFRNTKFRRGIFVAIFDREIVWRVRLKKAHPERERFVPVSFEKI